jgi:serine/threonine protein kinase
VIADRYLLEEEIARGGMGAVWAGFDREQHRRVAIKVIALDGGDGVEAGRFKREAEISQQLRGPSFVEVYDHGIVENEAYLVMELLKGETLHERLRRVGTLTTDEAMVLLRSVASCLRLAHTLQIVHRDLKPGNVFFAQAKPGKSGVISLDGKNEVVKLFDFGIAKNAWDDSRLTRPGMLLGSAFYMSPEQIRSGRDVDARSDLWSLGVILFRALTGARPFPGAAPEALAHILHDEPPGVRSLNPSLPVGLRVVLQKGAQQRGARALSDRRRHARCLRGRAARRVDLRPGERRQLGAGRHRTARHVERTATASAIAPSPEHGSHRQRSPHGRDVDIDLARRAAADGGVRHAGSRGAAVDHRCRVRCPRA